MMRPSYQQIAVYTERFFQRHKCTRFPTVLEVARRFNTGPNIIRETIEADSWVAVETPGGDRSLMLTSYNSVKKPEPWWEWVETV